MKVIMLELCRQKSHAVLVIGARFFLLDRKGFEVFDG
jgi:hypothetical protein